MHDALRGVVTVDGPSGTGKSTTARGLATRLDAHYLDTGAMYRAATLAVLRAGVPVDTTATDADGHGDVVDAALAARLELSTDPAAPAIRLNGQDVGVEIRGEAVTGAVSAVSALTAVREHLVAEQRRIVGETVAAGQGIVVEGRDIGTVVVPDAPLKVYLTASEMVRADRRTAEHTAVQNPAGENTATQSLGVGTAAATTATREALSRRDRLDSGRAASPLRAAEDAVRVDTSALDVDAVLTRLTDLAAERGLVGCAATIGANGG